MIRVHVSDQHPFNRQAFKIRFKDSAPQKTRFFRCNTRIDNRPALVVPQQPEIDPF